MIVKITDFPNKGLSGGCALWCGNFLILVEFHRWKVGDLPCCLVSYCTSCVLARESGNSGFAIE